MLCYGFPYKKANHLNRLFITSDLVVAKYTFPLIRNGGSYVGVSACVHP